MRTAVVGIAAKVFAGEGELAFRQYCQHNFENDVILPPHHAASKAAH